MTLTSEYRHTPVMLTEILHALNPQQGDVMCDCTLGGAGHSLEIGKRINPDGFLIGIDQDDLALEVASTRIARELPGLQTAQLKGNFAQIDQLLVGLEIPYVDGFLFDLGVSSPQLDIPERGFSYKEEAPLDMRMDPSNNTLTAAEVINTYTTEDLTRIIRTYGEERFAQRIASHITTARERQPIQTTIELAELIKQAIPAAARRTGKNPARKTFQALRIEVNHELEVLEQGLRAAVTWLSAGGVLCVISYHSLEDRIVKELFQELSTTCICPPELPVCSCDVTPVVELVTRKPLVPTSEEIERNPRSRSAKLRVAKKIEE